MLSSEQLDRLEYGAGARLQVADPLADAELWVPSDLSLATGPPGPARLEWRGGDWIKGAGPRDCLREFVGLVDATDKEIERFARRYGVLGVCPHGRPATHRGESPTGGCCPLGGGLRMWGDPAEQSEWMGRGIPAIDASGYPDWNEERRRGPRHWEQTAAWRCFARGLEATLAIAFAVQEGQPASPSRWRAAEVRRPELAALDRVKGDEQAEARIHHAIAHADPATWGESQDGWPSLDDDYWRPPRDEWLQRLASLVELRLQDADLRPTLGWDRRGDRLRLVPTLSPDGLPDGSAHPERGDRAPGTALYCVLALQLLAAVASGGIAACTICSAHYPYDRKPRRDKPNFCGDDCRHARRKQTKADNARERYRIRRGINAP